MIERIDLLILTMLIVICLIVGVATVQWYLIEIRDELRKIRRILKETK